MSCPLYLINCILHFSIIFIVISILLILYYYYYSYLQAASLNTEQGIPEIWITKYVNTSYRHAKWNYKILMSERQCLHEYLSLNRIFGEMFSQNAWGLSLMLYNKFKNYEVRTITFTCNVCKRFLVTILKRDGAFCRIRTNSRQ